MQYQVIGRKKSGIVLTVHFVNGRAGIKEATAKILNLYPSAVIEIKPDKKELPQEVATPRIATKKKTVLSVYSGVSYFVNQAGGDMI